MRFRGSIPDFQLANPLYRGATVTFYRADTNGLVTPERANLYAAPVGTALVTNPQVLDGDGKFARPVYTDDTVVAIVVSSNVESHATGPIAPRGTHRGAYASGERYNLGDTVNDTINENLYVAADDFIADTLAADLAAGRLDFVLGAQVFKDLIPTLQGLVAGAQEAVGQTALNLAGTINDRNATAADRKAVADDRAVVIEQTALAVQAASDAEEAISMFVITTTPPNNNDGRPNGTVLLLIA